jgi:UDP-N-acetylmuramoyl-L-alanyl-D-glutamate--2,6-diaminopimelate ligase
VRGPSRAGSRPFAVVVDYAHNPDSLQRVLTMARGLTERRVICVFGCTGDRDRGKRPLMAEIACELADRVVVTTDDPFSEDPDTILDDIMAGTDADAERVDDRRAAFAHAIALARPGDTVVIAGRGHHEDQMLADGRTRPFHDAAVAAEELRAAGHRHSG